MPEGKIRWFSHKLGIGFIRTAGGENIFFRTGVGEHGDSTIIHDGQHVRFDVIEKSNGLSSVAKNVKLF